MRVDSNIRTPNAYIASLPEDRRAAVRQLHSLIRKTVPGLKPCITLGMLGYGPYHDRYPGGREGDWAVIGLAARKGYLSLSVCAADAGGYVAEKYRDRLPKANIGKSCVRFKRVEDVDLDVIREMLKHAERVGGMGAVR